MASTVRTGCADTILLLKLEWFETLFYHMWGVTDGEFSCMWLTCITDSLGLVNMVEMRPVWWYAWQR